MTDLFADPAFVIPALLVGAVLCQWLAWYAKLPAILFLLLTGILLGPIAGWFDPQAVFGELLLPMVSLSVAVILFEGALTLKFDEIRGVEGVVRKMVTTGSMITWLVTTLATHYAVGLSWGLSFLFGAIMVVTGPTVVIPMLRTVRPNARIANILRWEGIVIDPLGALLAVLVFEFIVSEQAGNALSHTFITFAGTVATGTLAGAAAGHAFGITLRRHWLPEYLQNVAALAAVCATFAISDAVQEESGLLAVTIMGMWLANMRNVSVDDILHFKESLSVLLISALFIILAARMSFAEMAQLGFASLVVLLVMQFIARPLKVFLSARNSDLTLQERLLLSWIGPRGIVAAAVSALFAIRLESAGYENASALVSLTFIIIIGTVVLQGTTARWIALRLGVGEPEPRGFLIVGAGPVARAIGKALNDRGYPAMLADTSWFHVRAARMAGLNCYYGNPVSAHADQHLDLVGIGRLLAVSAHAELNALASVKYRREFGPQGIYILPTASESATDKQRISSSHGALLFREDVDYNTLSTWLNEGAEVRATSLTETFDFDSYNEKYGERTIPLFALDAKKRLQVFAHGAKIKPGPGWQVVALVRPDTALATEASAPQSARPEVI